MDITARVIQVGFGHIEGSDQVWAKVVAIADEPTTGGPLPGLKIVDYAIVGSDGKPDLEAAQVIRDSFLSKVKADPVPMKFAVSMKVRGKNNVLVITRLAERAAA